jgi:hypothetical protein
MPRISEFYGIVISRYHEDHLPPHFHADHAGVGATFSIDGRLLWGAIHPRAARLVREWARLHRRELLENWFRARNRLELVGIEPLE